MATPAPTPNASQAPGTRTTSGTTAERVVTEAGGAADWKALALRATDALNRRTAKPGALEAPTGRRIRVVAIRAGMSKNRYRYDAETLRRAVEAGHFDRCPVYANHPPYSDRVAHPHDVGSLAGEFVGGQWDPTIGEAGAVVGEVEFGEEPRAPMMRAVMATKPHLLAFSVVMGLVVTEGEDADGHFYAVAEVQRLYSLDVVDFPGAGGGTLEVMEGEALRSSHGPEDNMEPKQVSEAEVKVRVMERERELAAQAQERERVAAEAHRTAMAQEAEKRATAEKRAQEAEARATEAETKLKALEAKLVAAEGEANANAVRVALEAKLAGSALPKVTKDRLRASYAGDAAIRATVSQAEGDVAAAEEYVASLAEELGVKAPTPVVGAGEPDHPRTGGQSPSVNQEAERVAAEATRRLNVLLGTAPAGK